MVANLLRYAFNSITCKRVITSSTSVRWSLMYLAKQPETNNVF